MNKNTLPILIAVTAIIASAVAFAEPVDEVSAVHTTLQQTIGTIQVVSDTDTAWNAAETLSWSCTGNSIVYAIGLDLTAGAGAFQIGDDIDVAIDSDGAGADFDAITLEADIFGGAVVADSEDILQREVAVDDTFKKFTLENGGTVTVTLAAEAGATDIDNAVATLFAVSTGTCSAT